MTLIREDLFQAILQLGKTSNLACLSGVTQVVLGLYVHLGKHLLLQLESYLNLVLLRVAEGKGAGVGGGGGGSDHQEAALEVMLQVFFNPLLVYYPSPAWEFSSTLCLCAVLMLLYNVTWTGNMVGIGVVGGCGFA